MKGTAKTRTQRRMEKRQAIILLVLVLVVSLASFTLGVIVGRRGTERDLAQQQQSMERVLVAQSPTRVAVPAALPATGKVVEEPAVEPVTEQTKLSFYDNLAKETAPLGSGINLAPVEEQPAVVANQPPIDLPDQPIAVVKQVTPDKLVVATPGTSGSEMPKVAANGSHAVQIGSFGAAGEAIALKQKLLDKAYPAFVVEADLGKKGLWYRVRIGPYADSAAAKLAQERLEEKEQLKGFITRQ